MNDVAEYLRELLKRAEAGELQGIVVYAVTPRNGACYGIVGGLGVDDFSILSVRAQMCAIDCLRAMEKQAGEGHPLNA